MSLNFTYLIVSAIITFIFICYRSTAIKYYRDSNFISSCFFTCVYLIILANSIIKINLGTELQEGVFVDKVFYPSKLISNNLIEYLIFCVLTTWVLRMLLHPKKDN
jgi:hypothetical protein